MNIKMTTNNYQPLSLNQKQKQTKETTRRGTEPQKLRSHKGLSAEEWVERERGKVQRKVA